MLGKFFFTLACLILPILWGVAVNWMFNLWHSRATEKPESEQIFPDYQI